MRGQEFLEKMELIEPEYIEEADRKPTRKKRIWKGLAVAACLCLLFGAITGATTGAFGTRLIRSFTASPDAEGEEESGYDLNILMERKPVRAFSKEIRSLKKTFIQQFKNPDPISSQMPGSYYQSFPSSAEACAYIGLPTLKAPKLDGMTETNCRLSVLGNAKGKLLLLTLETDYEINNIRLQAFTHIYTEYYEQEITIRSRTTESIRFTESFETNEQGNQYQVIRSSAMESGFLGIDGFLVDEGILYSLHIAYLEEDTEQAEELMRRWANLF